MAYTTSEARQELLDSVEQAANELGVAVACLAAAYEQLDEHNGDRLEDECFRPVQMAYGRAKRTHTEFARRHGIPSQGAAAFVGRAVEAAGEADRTLAELQDSMLPVEAGDEELRAGIRAIREPLSGLPASARGFLRGLGR
jgi:hypothetical protein